MDYRETLEMVNNKIKNLKLKDLHELDILSTELFYIKEPFILAKEGTIEFYTLRIIQNICVSIDECRRKYLEENITLAEIEKKIKSSWNKDYNKF